MRIGHLVRTRDFVVEDTGEDSGLGTLAPFRIQHTVYSTDTDYLLGDTDPM